MEGRCRPSYGWHHSTISNIHGNGAEPLWKVHNKLAIESQHISDGTNYGNGCMQEVGIVAGAPE